MNDKEIDLWNDAVLAALRGQPCPSNSKASREGYSHGLEQRKVQPVGPERPEGYYHQPIAD